MSLPPAEERKLQRRKIEQLDYLAFLLERLLWQSAPGVKEFVEFQEMIQEIYRVSQHIPDEVA